MENMSPVALIIFIVLGFIIILFLLSAFSSDRKNIENVCEKKPCGESENDDSISSREDCEHTKNNYFKKYYKSSGRTRNTGEVKPGSSAENDLENLNSFLCSGIKNGEEIKNKISAMNERKKILFGSLSELKELESSGKGSHEISEKIKNIKREFQSINYAISEFYSSCVRVDKENLATSLGVKDSIKYKILSLGNSISKKQTKEAQKMLGEIDKKILFQLYNGFK